MADSAANVPGMVFYRGRNVPASEAGVPVSDHGLAYGLGFFETFRTSGGRAHAWERHQRRLESACQRAGMALPESFLARAASRREQAIRELLAAYGWDDAVFRYTITAGPWNSRDGYTAPAELLALRPLPPPAPVEGVTMRLLQLTRDNGEWLPRPKSLNYANALLGGHELGRRTERTDDEGLFVSREGGFVVETARQNIAWVTRGQWCIPDPTLGAVAGTCVEWALDGIGAIAQRVPPAALAAAEAVVVFNAVRGVTPVARLWNGTDDRLLGEWRSDQHPQVIAWQKAWTDALRATAGG